MEDMITSYVITAIVTGEFMFGSTDIGWEIMMDNFFGWKTGTLSTDMTFGTETEQSQSWRFSLGFLRASLQHQLFGSQSGVVLTPEAAMLSYLQFNLGTPLMTGAFLWKVDYTEEGQGIMTIEDTMSRSSFNFHIGEDITQPGVPETNVRITYEVPLWW